MSGWIKVYRSLWEKGWSNKPEYVALWCYLIKEASFGSREYFWNGNTIILDPGQFISGRNKIASETGINSSKVERILKTFESEQQIEQRKTSTSRLITILNYAEYQESEQQSEQRVNSECTTSEQRVNNNKERKNIKKEININNKNILKFKKPTVGEMEDYLFQKFTNIPHTDVPDLAEEIFDSYQAKGWVVGKARTPMKDWKAAIRTWMRNKAKYEKKYNGNNSKSGNSNGKPKTVGSIPIDVAEEFIARGPIPKWN